jgi:hypothetical protein
LSGGGGSSFALDDAADRVLRLARPGAEPVVKFRDYSHHFRQGR